MTDAPLVFSPMPKEALMAKVAEVVEQIRTLEGEEFTQVCVQFTGHWNTFDRYIPMSAEERTAEFDGLVASNAPIEAMEYYQITYCVLASLTTEELEKVRQGTLDAQAQIDGFHDFAERTELKRSTAERMINILNAGQGPHSQEYKIALEFANKHSALLMGQFLHLYTEWGQAVDACMRVLQHVNKSGIEHIQMNLGEAEQALDALEV